MSGFGRIAQKAAFHEQRGPLGFSQHPETGRHHAAICSPRQGGQITLDARSQLPRSPSVVVGFRAVNAAASGVVEMNGDKDRVPVTVGAVGNAGAFIQRDKRVVAAGHHRAEPGGAQLPVQPARHIQRQIFLQQPRAPPGKRPGIVPAVPGVDHHRVKVSDIIIGHRRATAQPDEAGQAESRNTRRAHPSGGD